MNALITGGAGYVGNLLAKALLEQGHHVTVLDNFMFGYDSILHIVDHPQLSVLKQDIRHSDMTYLAGHEVVFHLAAISGYPACEANPHSAQLINVDATQRIVANLAPDQLIIYASTTSLYGADGERSTEQTEVRPTSLYGSTKYAAEKIVMAHGRAIALRWATVFGVSPRMRAGLMVNDFVEKAVHERALVLFQADSKRTFMHIRDSVPAYLFALEHAKVMTGNVYNMGSPRLNLSKRQLAEMIRKRIDFEIIEAEASDQDVRNFEVSFDRAKALGFDCQIEMDFGLAELIKLYRFYDPNSFIRPI
jgi:nucleoside-diphosphate-sugar epimerase